LNSSTDKLTLGLVHLFGNGHHLVELGVDVLFGLLEDVHQLPRLLCILCGEVGVRSSRVLGTGSTADAMDIVFRVVWEVKVDHILDVRHI